ncbi:hypothetical protein PXO_03890 [Xanthomonas oryzae pv. oryzae PXO99A]|uniref:Uncharacterized protein n=1 Tax=Xanthomonas oryzae pv. oryzae (strain PXO99A) TaxID=360094 RepID=A0A0K0GG57_XANOP|nr:hypothetical protein PXO_03890 [Xanthomonas oryzae pv. oryzae PXO99A]
MEVALESGHAAWRRLVEAAMGRKSGCRRCALKAFPQSVRRVVHRHMDCL